MRKFIYLFLMFISLPLIAENYKYDVSICMIFRDEAPYLKEWIEFHRLVGVDHFYLYNNLSQDNYQEILQPYIDKKIVDLVEWPKDAKNIAEWEDVQVGAYNDGLKKALDQTKWLAILDSDEFLFPVQEDNLRKYLKKYEGFHHIGGVLVNWVMYGTSHVEKIPDDKLLIETLVYSEALGNHHFKTICRPQCVDFVCSPHYVVYKDGYRHCGPSGQMPPFIEIDKIRINHYWSRDEWYLVNFKIPRRTIIGTLPQSCIAWAEEYNKDYDPSIFRFIKPLRKKMRK